MGFFFKCTVIEDICIPSRLNQTHTVPVPSYLRAKFLALELEVPVHLKTPPKATSSPNMTAVGSLVSAMSSASVTDWSRVILAVSPVQGRGVENNRQGNCVRLLMAYLNTGSLFYRQKLNSFN